MATPRSLLKTIEREPENQARHLRVLRLIVAERLDATESARETGTLARTILDIESALRALSGAGVERTPVDEVLERRKARGAK